MSSAGDPPSQAGFLISGGQDNIAAAATTDYLASQFNNAPSGFTGPGEPLPACTLRNLFVKLNNGQLAAANTLVATVMINGVASALTVSFANADGADAFKASNGAVVIAEGDLVLLRVVTTGGSATAKDCTWSIRAA